MKTIKSTILGLLLSSSMYGQTDTLVRMVSGKCYTEFDETSTHVLYKSNAENKGEYEDKFISIDSSQILLLHLYDNCERCDKSIKTRMIVLQNRDGSGKNFTVNSSSDVYYIDGNIVNSVIVRKPE